MHTALVDAVESEGHMGKRAVLFQLGVVAERRCVVLHSLFVPYFVEENELPRVATFFNRCSTKELEHDNSEAVTLPEIVDLLDSDLGGTEYEDIENLGPDDLQDEADVERGTF